MTRILPWSFAAIFLALGSVTLDAQECSNVEFFVINQAGENWPVLNVNYLISNANGMPTANGTWEVTPNGTTASFCLSVGCYSIALSGDAVNVETVGLELFQSDFIQILQLNLGEEGTWIADFCVEQGDSFNCPDAIDYAAGEGCSWAFEIGSFQEGESVTWNFGDGSEAVVGGHFIEHEFEFSGTYAVTAFFTSFDCPMGVELETVIEVIGCGETDPCDLYLSVSTDDGMWYTFTIPEQPEGAIIEWYIDGQVVPPTSENGLTFEAGFDFNPDWTVCVEVFTDACPEGAEACFSNLEDQDCPEVMGYDWEGCHYVFSIGELSNVEVAWSVDGEFVEWSHNVFDYTFTTDGEHVISGIYYSPTCQGENYELVINVEGCGDEEECPLHVVSVEIECNQFLVEALSFPEGVTLFWTLDGEPYDYGYAEMIFTFEEDGCHTFGVGYESENCPNFVYQEIEVCSNCNELNCEVSIQAEELADGIYLFSAVLNTGELYGGDVHWWTNGSNVGSGNPFAWTWDNDEETVESMCIGYAAWEDCAGGETCMELEISPMACEEIQLVLNGAWSADLEWAFELGLEALIDGWEIAGWEWSESWSGGDEFSDTLNLCVPPACFDVLFGWEAAAVDVDYLVALVLLAEGDPTTIFNWFEPYNDFGFGLLPDCFEGTLVPFADSAEDLISIWPNPAHDRISWQLPEDLDAGWMQIHALDGRLQYESYAGQNSGSLDLTDWPQGWYFVSWISKDGQRLSAPFAKVD